MNENYGIVEEINSLKYVRKPMYSAYLMRYPLLPRYTSLSSYKLLLNELKLSSVSFLRKITEGDIDVTATARLLKFHGKISLDVMLVFDVSSISKIHLQKYEEYV